MAKKDAPEDPDRADIKKLRKLIKSTRIAMLTTTAADGSLRSRPMATLKARFDGDLWFFTRAAAPKAGEIRDNGRVNLSYVDADEDRYLSVSGVASVVRDSDRTDDLWQGRFKAWFPEGKKDPDLALLRVRVDHAEYWDAKSAAMVPLAGLVKALATGAPAPSGGGTPGVKNRKVDVAGGEDGGSAGSGAQG